MNNFNTFAKIKNMSVYTTFFILTISLTLLNCNNETSSKIPVTTNSEKALEYYTEGLLLTEKLRGQEAAYYYIKAIAEDKEFAMAYIQLALVHYRFCLRCRFPPQ